MALSTGCCRSFDYRNNQVINQMSEPTKTENRGGARPGAGRKPNALKEQHVSIFDTAWPLERRIAAIQRIANIVELSDDDEIALKAAELLFNRVYGKPTERKEISGENGGPIALAPVDYRAGLDALRPDDADT